jgi:mRNA interferase RelE/StbE
LRKYKIFETERFAQDIKLLARSGRTQLEEKIHEYVYSQLKEEPHFGPNIKKLKGWTPCTWRYRIGDWRFFYIVDEEMRVVSMLAASHRKEAYR